ncbi:MAG: hypothetical protein N2037_02845 [Acidimicrobiales bacterium]|nr:hypothetical protein [Acidimicrobiales bacterium]
METNHQRIAEFREEIASLTVRSPVDAAERTWLLTGIGLGALGVVVILIAWFGASGTAIVAEQIPYLISGGLLGLGLIIAGGALFVRYSLSRYLRFWLVRYLYEHRVQTDRMIEALERLESALRPAEPVDR